MGYLMHGSETQRSDAGSYPLPGLVEDIAVGCRSQGWDGHNAIAVTPAAVTTARRFAQSLKVSGGSDGSVHLAWQATPAVDLDVEIDSTGNIEYVTIAPHADRPAVHDGAWPATPAQQLERLDHLSTDRAGGTAVPVPSVSVTRARMLITEVTAEPGLNGGIQIIFQWAGWNIETEIAATGAFGSLWFQPDHEGSR